MLASCTESSTDSELRIVDQCNTASGLCKFELTDAVVIRQSFILGKATTRVVSQTPIQSIEGDITWVAPDGTLANNATVETAFVTGCENDDCTYSANPTAFEFGTGNHSVSVTGTIIHNGQSINLADAVAPVSITTEAVADSHTFLRADAPALPAGQTIDNVVAAFNSNLTGANGTFSVVGNTWKITCNPNYEWLDSVNPAWGQPATSSSVRSVRFVSWTTSAGVWRNSPSSSSSTLNANAGKSFTAGCWPI